MPTSLANNHHRESPYWKVERLQAGYGKSVIVHDASLSLALGEVVAIVGANGAGKSTLLKAMVGLIPPLGGRITLGDDDVTELATDDLIRRVVGYVPQLRDIFETLTVAETLRMGGYLLSRQRVAERMDEIVAMFPQLSRLMTRRGLNLSGGERKLVACGRALMAEPKVLVLDEPTASLSQERAKELLEDIVPQLVAGGTGVLLVEQKMRAAMECADWAYVLVAGRVRLEGPSATLLEVADLPDILLGHSHPSVSSETYAKDKSEF